MLDAVIDVDRVLLAGLLQRCLVGIDAGVDALVEPGIVEQKRRLDLGDILRLGLPAVIGHRSIEIGRIDGQIVDHPAAPAEADHPDLAIGTAVRLEVVDHRHSFGDRLLHAELFEHRPGLILVGRRAAERRQKIRRQDDEALERHAPCDVADVVVQAAVFMDHDHRRQLAGRGGGTHQIAFDRTAVLAGDRHLLGLQPAVVRRHDRCARKVGGKQGRDCRRSGGRTGELGEVVHEPAAIEGEMRIFVISVDHRLGDLRRRHLCGSSTPSTIADIAISPEGSNQRFLSIDSKRPEPAPFSF